MCVCVRQDLVVCVYLGASAGLLVYTCCWRIMLLPLFTVTQVLIICIHFGMCIFCEFISVDNSTNVCAH